ncbi:hypothetical protein D3C84_1052740 [compost metagenome]
MDGARHTRQHIQIRVRQPRRSFTRHPSFELKRLAITKGLSQPRHNSFGRVIEQRTEVSAKDIGLGLGVIVDIAGG